MSRTAIVVPCYNEERRLDADAFVEYAREAPDVRFVFVNDGSHDGTLEVLTSLAARMNGAADVLDLPVNGGKAEAVRRGVLAAFEADPGFVGYWDADLATPLSEVDRFRELLLLDPELWLVMGARVQLLGRDIARSPARHYLGRVFATVASLVLRLPVYDTQCGAKLMRVTPATRAIFAQPFGSRWIFDVELLARLVAAETPGEGAGAAARIYECPVDAWRDVAGSKVKPRDFLRAAFELYRIERRYMAGKGWLRPSRGRGVGVRR